MSRILNMLNVFVNTLFFGRRPGFNLFNIQRLELKAIKFLTFYLCFYLLFFNYLIFYKIKMLSAETENILYFAGSEIFISNIFSAALFVFLSAAARAWSIGIDLFHHRNHFTISARGR